MVLKKYINIVVKLEFIYFGGWSTQRIDRQKLTVYIQRKKYYGLPIIGCIVSDTIYMKKKHLTNKGVDWTKVQMTEVGFVRD